VLIKEKISRDETSGGGYIQPLLLILIIVALAYANSLDNSFHFDDEHSLIKNPHIRQLENIPAFFTDPQMFSRNVGSGMYRPLVLVSYALNYRLGGYEGRGYHLVNLGIHLLTVSLVFGVFLQLGAGKRLALLGALFFGIHPLTAEPVNYISSRSESLAGLFYLSSLFFFLKSRHRISPLSILCFVAGLLTKSIVLSLPLLLLVYEWAFDGQSWRTWWRRHLPYWTASLLYLWVIRELIGEALVQAPVRSWTEQLGTQVKALVYYVKLVFLPQPLSVEHQFFVSNSFLEGAVLAALALAISLGFMGSRRKRPALFWLAWMVISLLPTLIVPLNVLVNERRLYLPLVGFAGFLLWLGQGREWGRNSILVAGLGLMGLGTLTVQRNQVWESETTLWQDAQRKAPLMVRPYLRLGSLHREAGRLDRAEEAYRRVLELDPGSAPAFNNLGNLHVQKGDLEAAEQAYKKSLEILPSYVEALVNLGTLYSRQNRMGEALDLYQEALPLSVHREEIYNNLGTTYLRLERFVEAERALRQALELNPEQPGILFNLGGALEGQGREEEAISAYERSIGVDPTYPRSYFNLGRLYARKGRLEEAARAYGGFLRFWDGEAGFADEARRRLQELSASSRSADD